MNDQNHLHLLLQYIKSYQQVLIPIPQFIQQKQTQTL